MKIAHLISALVLSMTALTAGAADGLIAVSSPHGVKATMDKLEELVKQRGLSVVARIDHAAGAKKVDKTLRPTELLIFGNPQVGTSLMECEQSVGIELPLKVLVWEDAASKVWLGYNDPAFLARRHGAAQCAVVDSVSTALRGLASAAVAP